LYSVFCSKREPLLETALDDEEAPPKGDSGTVLTVKRALPQGTEEEGLRGATRQSVEKKPLSTPTTIAKKLY